MNFQSILEELNKLYEEEKLTEEVVKEEVIAEDCDKTLTEDDDEEIEIVDDEAVAEEEPTVDEESEVAVQHVLECANCGALTIKAEADVVIDESGVANVEEACQYCEETKGYKVIGNFVPAVEESVEGPVGDVVEEEPEEVEVESEEDLDEGIFDSKKKKMKYDEIIENTFDGKSLNDLASDINWLVDEAYRNLSAVARKMVVEDDNLYHHLSKKFPALEKAAKSSDVVSILKTVLSSLSGYEDEPTLKQEIAELSELIKKLKQLAVTNDGKGVIKELTKLSQYSLPTIFRDLRIDLDKD